MVVARDRKHHADVKCEKHRFPRTLPIELNKTGTLPPTGNLKPNFRGSPQSRHAGKSAVKTQNIVFEKEKSE